MSRRVRVNNARLPGEPVEEKAKWSDAPAEKVKRAKWWDGFDQRHEDQLRRQAGLPPKRRAS